MRCPIRYTDRPAAEAAIAEGAVLIDARSLRQRGLRFLAGAARVPWTHTRTGGARSGLLLPAQELATVFTRAGVDWERPVLVVGAGASGWGEGARVAWALAWLGHPDVRWHPLFGPLPTARARPPSTARVPWPGHTVDALRAPGGVHIPPGAVVVDVRMAPEHAGSRVYGEARGGHIPGARFLGLHELWTAAGPTPVEEVRALARGAAIPSDADLVCVCTGGVRSAAAMVLLDRAGVGRTIRNHDGGMWAWSSDPQRPMAVRSLP